MCTVCCVYRVGARKHTCTCCACDAAATCTVCRAVVALPPSNCTHSRRAPPPPPAHHFLPRRPRLATTHSEWVTNHHRDSAASHIGHPDMLSFFAIAENESVGRMRYTLLEVSAWGGGGHGWGHCVVACVVVVRACLPAWCLHACLHACWPAVMHAHVS